MTNREQRPSGVLQRPRVRLAIMLALLGLALSVPRALTLHGIRVAAIFEFADMADHLYFLDTLAKRRLDKHAGDPFFQMFPETLPDRLAEQWTTGVYHVARLWALPLGTGSLWTTQLTNLLFTLILLGAVVGLGSTLGGIRVGLWGALLTALCPALVASTWYFSLDYPLIGMTTMGLYILWKSRGFTLWKWVILFALWSALGTVIKPTYAVYLLGPAAWVLALQLWRGPRLLALLRVAAGLGLSLGLVYVLYRPNWDQVLNETRVHFVDRTLPGASIDPLTLEWFVSNIKMALVNFPAPLLALALPGLLLLHFPRSSGAGRWSRLRALLPPRAGGTDHGFWISYLWSTYLFLTLLANKMERYIQPVYPVFCLLAVWWVVDRLPRRFQTPSLSALALAFAALLVTTHYQPIPWFPQDRDTIPQESSLHPFRYEFHMPGKQRLAALRELQLDSACQIKPVLDQISRWIQVDATPRPLALIYLRDPKRMTKMHPPVFFRRLIPALTLTVRDRIFVVPNLHEMDRVPMHLRHAPNVMIIHGPEIRRQDIPAPLQVKARRMLSVACMGEDFPFGLTWARPAPGSVGPARQ